MHKKYTYKNGKRYGPYLYENKRIDGKVVTQYLGLSKDANVSPHSHNSSSGTEKARNVLAVNKQYIGIGFIVLLLFVAGLLFYQNGFFTGNVLLGIEESYTYGEALGGNIRFTLGEDEFLPVGTMVSVSIGNNSQTINLEDLLDLTPSTGEFLPEKNPQNSTNPVKDSFK